MAGYLYDVLAAVESPDEIRAGTNGAFLAIRESEAGKRLVVVYREATSQDGFIITAFFTRELNWLEKRTKLWP
jgi:hypothetical protein